MKKFEDAMHRTEVHEDVSDDDLASLIERMAAEWPSPANYLPKLKQQITDVLVAKGCPEPGAVVRHKGRDWRIFADGEKPEPGERVSRGWEFIRRNWEPLTPEREAADIYFIVMEVEHALGSGDVEKVFAHALRLGRSVNQFNARRLHLRKVTIGRSQQEAGRRGNAMRVDTSFRSVHGVKAEKQARDISKRNPNLSWSAIRIILAREFGVSPETIKKAVPNPKKGG